MTAFTERFRRPPTPPEQFTRLSGERNALWQALTGNTPIVPDPTKAAYGILQFSSTEEEARDELRPRNELERLYANLLRRYKAGHLDEYDNFLITFSQGQTKNGGKSLLEIFPDPHYQARFLDDDNQRLALSFMETSDRKGNHYDVIIEAEEAPFSGERKEIIGYDPKQASLLWAPLRKTLDTPPPGTDIEWKKQFYQAALTHNTRTQNLSFTYYGRFPDARRIHPPEINEILHADIEKQPNSRGEFACVADYL